MRITLEHSCQIRSMYKLCSIKGKKLMGMFPQHCHTRIYVHAKKPLASGAVLDKRWLNKGRPRMLSGQDAVLFAILEIYTPQMVHLHLAIYN